MNTFLNTEECFVRFPRLLAKCRVVAALSATEAACAIRDYRLGRIALSGRNPFIPHLPSAVDWTNWGKDTLRYGGGEAVSHFGGPQKVIQKAVER